MPLLRKHHKLRKRWSESNTDPEFQVAPIADLLLVLVVFFMSITSMEFFHADRSIHLPEAKDGTNHPAKVDQLVIDVSWIRGLRTGSMKIENRTLKDPETLIPLLSRRLRTSPTLRVLIRADKDVEYSYVASIMQACRQAEISNVVFSVLTGGSFHPENQPKN